MTKFVSIKTLQDKNRNKYKFMSASVMKQQRLSFKDLREMGYPESKIISLKIQWIKQDIIDCENLYEDLFLKGKFDEAVNVANVREYHYQQLLKLRELRDGNHIQTKKHD